MPSRLLYRFLASRAPDSSRRPISLPLIRHPRDSPLGQPRMLNLVRKWIRQERQECDERPVKVSAAEARQPPRPGEPSDGAPNSSLGISHRSFRSYNFTNSSIIQQLIFSSLTLFPFPARCAIYVPRGIHPHP